MIASKGRGKRGADLDRVIDLPISVTFSQSANFSFVWLLFRIAETAVYEMSTLMVAPDQSSLESLLIGEGTLAPRADPPLVLSRGHNRFSAFDFTLLLTVGFSFEITVLVVKNELVVKTGHISLLESNATTGRTLRTSAKKLAVGLMSRL